MIELSKHVFEPLRRDEDSILYRGRKEGDSSHLLVLAPAKEEPRRESVRPLEHEYALREELDPEWSGDFLGHGLHFRIAHKRQIRALVKKASAAQEPVAINPIIQEVLALTQPELRRNRVSLQTQFADHLPIVLGDKVQLQQVILNLVMNAIEAMNGVAEGARELQVSSQRITETRFEPGKETVETRDVSERGQSFVLIAVRDSGPGLDPAQLQRVFETFYTTKSLGMGMGLAISRSIIEAHRGRLWVSSNAPRGAVFQFTLPCQPGL